MSRHGVQRPDPLGQVLLGRLIQAQAVRDAGRHQLLVHQSTAPA
ncbi:hypothetical protein ACWDRR_03945 [Kitasatospora sp. NPDC003701]